MTVDTERSTAGGIDVPTTVGAVFVTGASTGIGRASALLLDRQGYRVFAGVRREESGETLRKIASTRLTPVLLDVTDPVSVEAAAKEIFRQLDSEPLRGIVNNAGISVPGLIELMPLDEFSRQLEVNLLGMVSVSKAFLPRLRADRGRIVNVGSLSGHMAMPSWGAYSASKFAVEGFTDSLRQEMRPFGVRVSLVAPGPTSTPIWSKAERLFRDSGRLDAGTENTGYQRAQRDLEGFLGLAVATAVRPEAVAKRVHHALSSHRPRSRYVVGLNAKLMSTATRLLPTGLLDLAIRATLATGRVATRLRRS